MPSSTPNASQRERGAGHCFVRRRLVARSRNAHHFSGSGWPRRAADPAGRACPCTAPSTRRGVGMLVLAIAVIMLAALAAGRMVAGARRAPYPGCRCRDRWRSRSGGADHAGQWLLRLPYDPWRAGRARPGWATTRRHTGRAGLYRRDTAQHADQPHSLAARLTRGRSAYCDALDPYFRSRTRATSPPISTLCTDKGCFFLLIGQPTK